MLRKKGQPFNHHYNLKTHKAQIHLVEALKAFLQDGHMRAMKQLRWPKVAIF